MKPEGDQHFSAKIYKPIRTGEYHKNSIFEPPRGDSNNKIIELLKEIRNLLQTKENHAICTGDPNCTCPPRDQLGM